MQNGRPSKTKKIANHDVHEGSGNVFADLAIPHADQLLAKAQLAQRIANLLAYRKLTQAKAAKLLGIDQPKISALLCGRLDGFSTDRLMRFLDAMNGDKMPEDLEEEGAVL